MGKNKLKKFDEMTRIPFVHQYPYGALREAGGFPLRGRWHEEQFGNSRPIVLELGCGKGEYTVELARRDPGRNYIGIDIKGARMHTGASQALREGLTNVAFLRTNIELLPEFFASGEVAEIWITFPDPQMKKARRRLTSTRFLDLYRRVCIPGARIHLKTDSPFLYAYTEALVQANSAVLSDAETCPDIDATAAADPNIDAILRIQTHYEKQWRQRGLTIKHIAFGLGPDGALAEPDIEPEPDTYRSYSRGYIQCPQLLEPDESNKQTHERTTTLPQPHP